MTTVIALFAAASLIAGTTLLILLGKQRIRWGATPHRIWTAPAPRGRFVEFLPDGHKTGYRLEMSKLGGHGLTIGRDPRKCDVVVRDWYVSARHARIWLDNEGLHIEDLKSTNGSWRNNSRIERSSFGLGESIRLGRTSFKLLAVEP